MTVSSAGGIIVLVGDGATISWSFNFSMPAVYSSSQAASFLTVVYTDPTGLTNVVPFGNGSFNYQVAVNSPVPPNPSSVGGILTYRPGGNPIPAGSSLTVQRTLPVVQSLSLTNQGTLWQPAIEGALDYLVMLAQGVVTPTGGPVSSFNGRGGAVELLPLDVFNAGAAALASPAFTGVPTAPTAPQGTNTTQIATTAFVQQNGGAGNRVLLQSTLITAPTLAVPMFYNFTNKYDQYELDIYDLQSDAVTSAVTYLIAQISWDGTSWDVAPNYQFVVNGYGSLTGNISGVVTNAVGLFCGWMAQAATTNIVSEHKIKFSMPWTSDRYKNFLVDSTANAGPNGLTRASASSQYYQPANGLLPIKGLRFLDPLGNHITRGVFNLYGILKASAGT